MAALLIEESIMSCPRYASLLVLLIIILSTVSCAPPAGMIATLTMLPGTFTPMPTHSPTRTPRPLTSPTDTPQAYPVSSLTPTPASTILSTTETVSNTESSPTPAETATMDATNAACPPFKLDTTLPVPDVPGSYIGRHYDTTALPTGISLLNSGMLSNPEYSYAQLLWQERNMFWIQKLVCHNSSGAQFWVINDALALPKLNPTANQVYTDTCFSKGVQIPFAIAYGNYDPGASTITISNFSGWKLQITSIWQMKDKFAAVAPGGVTCLVQNP